MALNAFDKICVFKGHTDYVKHIEKIDRRRFCTGGDDGVIVVIDIESCRRLHVLKDHHLPIMAMHCLPVRKDDASVPRHILATASADRKIIIWDVDRGVALHKMTGLISPAKCLASFAKYPNHIVSGGDKLVVWNVKDGTIEDAFIPSSTEYVRFMIVLHDLCVVVAIDDHLGVQFFHSKEAPIFGSDIKKLKPHREAITSLVKVNDDFFLSGSLDGVIMHWSAGTWECMCTYNYVTHYLGHMKVYPYSVQFLHVFEEDFLIAGIGRSLTIYNMASKMMLCSIENAHGGKINHIDVIYDGQFVATCSEDATIKIWRVFPENDIRCDAPLIHVLKKLPVKMELIETCSYHSASVMKCMSVGVDKFISCGNDRQIVLWMDGFAEEQAQYKELRRLMPY